MKLVFASGSLDHINYPLCSEFYRKLKNDFIFISTRKSSRELLGYKVKDNKSYLIKSYENDVEYNKALKYINDADVVIFGSAPEEMIRERLLDDKLTFRFTERLFKTKTNLFNILRRKLGLLKHHKKYENNNTYILCAGAYVAADFYKNKLYIDKYLKWCYFTEISNKTIDGLLELKAKNKIVEILWVGRFVKIKHPEIAVKAMRYIKDKGIEFRLTMVGDGEELEKCKHLSKRLGVENNILFTGAIVPKATKSLMEKSNIFLFSSDRREGWGAVLNEAMGAGCAVLTSRQAGSSLMLVEDGVNGIIFNLNDKVSFYNGLLNLCLNKKLRINLANKAFKTVHKYWTPKRAAENFIKYSRGILDKKPICIKNGPCSNCELFYD